MPNCQNCGNHMGHDEIYRREIYSGRSNRVSYGKRITFGTSTHYSIKNVCLTCATEIDNANKKSNNSTTIFLLIIAITVGLYFLITK